MSQARSWERKIALICSLLWSWSQIKIKNWEVKMIFFMFWSNVIIFKFYYICGVPIYHMIYSYSLSKDQSKEQSMKQTNCLNAQ
jgi:hypothetical protein